MRSYISGQALPHAARQSDTALVSFALSLLDSAAGFAVVPVSQFRVGAVAIDEIGNLYLGANQEFAGAAMAQTIHAEQSAIASAWRRSARQLAHIVVNHTPCGHCRQFMNELNGADRLQIHLPHSRDNPLVTLLPENFGPADLSKDERIFTNQRHTLFGIGDRDGQAYEAFLMATRSYAPYSGAYAGVCLSDLQGGLYSGAYLENAAFNPSLPPLQMAINEVHLAGKSLRDIVSATLVCVPEKGHEAHAQALWTQLSASPLEIIAVHESRDNRLI